MGLNSDMAKLQRLRTQAEVPDKQFCQLCQGLRTWVTEKRKTWKLLGLRSAENYNDPVDGARIATIYWLFSNSGKKAPQMPVMRSPEFFFQEGISWTRGANHVALKCKLVVPSVMDVNAMKISPVTSAKVTAMFLLAIFNSDIFSFYLKKFLAHTWMAQISDVRMMPLVMPTRGQEKRLRELAERAIEAKRLTFAGKTPPNDLVAAVRGLSDELAAQAPPYLRPSAQLKLLHTAADCLAAIELAVNWEAEKLYGVEGLGPFNEF
jgi:hypothetical protein